MQLGRWCWIGHGSKIRAHEGEVEIGAKTVIGQECTISAFQHVSDRARVHRRRPRDADRLRPRRRRGRAARSALQGIYKRDVHVGNNCWIGYGACILRGATVGDNSVVGTSSVVTKDMPANSVAPASPPASCGCATSRRRFAGAERLLAADRPGRRCRAAASSLAAMRVLDGLGGLGRVAGAAERAQVARENWYLPR